MTMFNMTRKSQQTPDHSNHQHYVITCGGCDFRFPSCGIPCFIVCPACAAIIRLWEA